MAKDLTEKIESGHPHDVTARLPTGYEGDNIPEEFSIPPCGIEDIDRSVFTLFDKVIKFNFKSRAGNVDHVPVIFAGGERFGMLKSRKPLRDSNGVLILPLIAIVRDSIDQSETAGGMRGIGQDTGDFVIRTRLDKMDRRHQNLRNKLGLQNQVDVAAPSHETTRTTTVNGTTVGTLGTRSATGARKWDLSRGEVLSPDLSDNIVEVITIPFPEFFSVKYTITFWTQYLEQMNSLLEQLMAAYHAQGNQFKLETPKGYWFVGFVDDEVTSDSNFSDYTDEERVVKYTITMRTSGYLVAPRREGQRSPFRRYLSAPSIEFVTRDAPSGLESTSPYGAGSGDPEKFTLSDTDLLDKMGGEAIGRNHSPFGVGKLVENPFTGKQERQFLRVKTRYQRQGESVLVPTDDDIDFPIEEP